MDFKSAYSRTAYTAFFRDSLLPEDYLVLSEAVEIEFGSKYFKQVTFLGKCPSLDLNVYEITHSSLSDARVGLSRDAFKLIARQMENNALILFVPENAENYRLSLVTIDPKLDSEGIKILKEYSNPRRFSFSLGMGIKTHTIEQFLVKAGRISSIDDLKKRFSVELLTKEFYNELSNWYFWALQNVKFPNDSENDDAVLNATSTIRLITRIMFVWFLKQKGIIPDILFDKDTLKSVLNYTDKTNSNYYKAILQNLFFATLNQEMNARAFRRDGEQYNITNIYRYKKLFIQNEAAFKLFENIPFLNGGLFECLDKPHPTLKTSRGGDLIIRIDGFSDREDNVLCVPDFLFFGGSTNVDLNQAYGDKTHGKVEVKGLIDILSTYNFTIEENTPVEIEVALDPELLGKVFENLLASYNPETKSTARKQTGSFYTPRDIVNYMVDESLAVYLKDKMLERTKSISVLGSNQIELFGNETRNGQLKLEQDHSLSKWSGKEDTLEKNLKQLLSFDYESNPFDKQDSAMLMHILDGCKILDPACGSGAFPMGVLQKMVHILQKLDKDNHHWQQIQEDRAKTENAELIKRIEKDKEHAALISFEDIRKKLLKELDDRLIEIKKSFDLNANEPDYARKLFLIENCIYGVDIQPIAVQIAKLRFFISLVIDQKVDDSLPNRGILTLPNLETKFLAANSLIGLDQNSTAKPTCVYPLEKQLKEVRHKHFSARTPETKRKYRELDSSLRLQISNELKGAGFHPTSADKIANWDPYNQNISAGFFDREWMFGLSEGFDIVIGNPPYVQVSKGLYDKHVFPFSEGKDKGKQNLYKVFVEAAYNLSKNRGISCLIVQSSLLCDLSSQYTRELLLKTSKIHQIIEFPKKSDNKEGQVFESVLQGTCIYIVGKILPEKNSVFKLSINNNINTLKEISCELINQLRLLEIYPDNLYIPLIRKGDFDIMNRIWMKSKPLKYYIKSICQGDLNLTVSKENISKEPSDVKLYRGRNIGRYILNENTDEFIKNDFLSDKVIENISKVFLVCQEVTGTVDARRLHFCNTSLNDLYLFGHTANKIALKEEYNFKFFLSILNSLLMDWYFRKTSTNNHVMGYEIVQLPIVNQIDQTLAVELVDRIIAAKKTNPLSDTLQWEAEIDALVFLLYGLTEEEILQVLGSLPSVSEDERNQILAHWHQLNK